MKKSLTKQRRLSEEAASLIFGLVIGLFFGAIISGGCVGDYMREDAAKYGAGHYTVNPQTGYKTYKWTGE